jgi:hypothetical protein
MKRRNAEQKQEEERVRREMQAAENNQRRLDQMIPQAGGERVNPAVEKALDWKKRNSKSFLLKK